MGTSIEYHGTWEATYLDRQIVQAGHSQRKYPSTTTNQGDKKMHINKPGTYVYTAHVHVVRVPSVFVTWHGADSSSVVSRASQATHPLGFCTGLLRRFSE